MAGQWLPISELAAAVRKGETSASELVEKALALIAEKSEYQAVIATTELRARDRAKALDAQVAAGEGEGLGRLAGVPFIAKDNFLVFGADTTAASNMLRGFQAPYQATAIERLEAEGAICVAKANLDAFAHGSSTENSDFMTTKNPHDRERVPGGSSGGSAAAVVLEMVPFALGTDTGGSIRLPASFCGAVGYKPTYGLVSRSGVVAMASSTDTIGPLTMTIADAAYVLDIMAGSDPLDSTTIAKDPIGYLGAKTDLRGAKVGVIREYLSEGVSGGVRATITSAIDALRAAGADITEVSLPSLPAALAVYYIICPAEVSSNLSRYDGQRYGYTASDTKTVDESISMTRSQGFGDEAKRRIMIGTYVLSSGYYEAYYKQAQTVRTKIINEYAEVFKSVDFLVGPVAPTTAFKIGENANDPLQMYLTDIMTVAANLAGIPAISVPAGTSDGLPVGLQLQAAQGQDRALLGLASSVEGVLA
ncbi:MAG TPA: Asp-tRNA(Asn)/Glu-tRNA(Gln) amidotransferase subunit GatA [Candidatus Limnocylindrales bacterium]|nr:Asp-tRNA(Asn)/Glu-tRNA(Gln) amidotransferase subunit GatA [Candidatus Limnocylindrales bacterium]